VGVSAIVLATTVEGFTFTRQSCGNSFLSRNQGTIQIERASPNNKNSLTMYVPSPSGSSSIPGLSTGSQTSIMAASTVYPDTNGLVNPTDSLPAFYTCSGLLSPQTVKRLDEANTKACGTLRSDAVGYFVDTYKDFGPMACLGMLSDPDVLPELTRAMRDSQI